MRRATERERLGTGYQGTVKATYDALRHAFGDPHMVGSPDGKTNAEWCWFFDEGVVATVYDYKESRPPQDVTIWHVGGTSPRAVGLIEERLAA